MAASLQQLSTLVSHGRALAQQAATAAYKYVTVEEPDPRGTYYYSKPTGERLLITNEKIRPLAIQLERLERDRVRWMHLANIGGGISAAPVAVAEWADNRLLALLYCAGVLKGVSYLKKSINQFFNPKIEQLKQQIARDMEALSGKKTE